MSLKTYLVLISLATALSWIGLFLVLAFIDPYSKPIIGLGLFYMTLFLSLLGSFSLLGFGFRFFVKKDQLAYRQVNIASRQAVMLSMLLIFSMLLQSQRMLYWWTILLIVIIFTCIEIFFIAKAKK